MEGFTMTETTTPARPQIDRVRTRHLRRAATPVAAALLALLAWTISVPILGVDLVVGSGPSTQTVGPVAVAIVPLIAGGLAWALLALLEKVGATGRRIWQVVGWVVLTVSLIGPVTMATSIGVLITLLAMHLIVGTTVLFGLLSGRKNE